MADEEEVFLPNAGGADGILDQVIVQAGLAVIERSAQALPVVEQVRARFRGKCPTVDPLYAGAKSG
jgi:hypothetical protein